MGHIKIECENCGNKNIVSTSRKRDRKLNKFRKLTCGQCGSQEYKILIIFIILGFAFYGLGVLIQKI